MLQMCMLKKDNHPCQQDMSHADDRSYGGVQQIQFVTFISTKVIERSVMAPQTIQNAATDIAHCWPTIHTLGMSPF